jgi:hypothetical protein
VDRIELEDIPLAPQPAVSVEQLGLRQGEERLIGGNRALVGGGDPCLGLEVEGIADVLEPPQAERREHGRRRWASLGIVGMDRIHGQMRGTVGQLRGRGLGAFLVLHQAHAADLDHGVCEAEFGKAPHLLGQVRDVVLRISVWRRRKSLKSSAAVPA